MLSYRYFALAVGFGRSAHCGGFASKIFASAIWCWVPPKKRKTRLWEILPIPGKWAFELEGTYLLGMVGIKKMRKLLPIPTKCVSDNAKAHLLGMDTQNKWMGRKLPIPSKCVLAKVGTDLLGGSRKMPRAEKSQCQNRQLIAAGWSIFDERRRRYFSSR